MSIVLTSTRISYPPRCQSIGFSKNELEYSLIVLELCIQDKAQADDERMLGHKHMNTNLNLLTASQSYIKIASKISAIK